MKTSASALRIAALRPDWTVSAWLIFPGLLLSLCGPLSAEPAEDQSQEPQRIISTAPSITETIFALGGGERLVGVTTYCDYPPEAKKLPKIGDFASPNVEVMLGLSPDLVVSLKSRGDIREKLQAFSMPLFEVRQEDLSSIIQSIHELGVRLGREEAAQQLTKEITEEIAAVRERVERQPAKPRILVLIGRNQGSLTDLYAVGPEGFLGELIRIAGGKNIFADSTVQYPKVSIEAILARRPDVIVDLSYGQPSETNRETTLRLWQRFPTIPAVRNGRVGVTSNDVFLLPGPRIGQAVKMLASMIHDEDF